MRKIKEMFVYLCFNIREYSLLDIVVLLKYFQRRILESLSEQI